MRASYINIPLLVLVFLFVCSCFNAEYKTIALVGFYNQHEGALTYLCYFALFFVAANTVIKENFTRYIIWALGFLTIVNTVIILAKFLGYNLLQLSLLRVLTLPVDIQKYGLGSISNTLGNPNYGSGLAAALFVLFFTLMILQPGLKERLLYASGSILAFIMVMGSLSSSGFVSILIVSPLIIAVAFLSPQRKQSLLSGGGLILLCFGVFFTMNAYNPLVGHESVGFIMSIFEIDSLTPEASAPSSAITAGQVAEANNNNLRTAVSRQSSTPSRGAVPTENFNLPSPGFAAGTGRLYTWAETIKLIQARPWLGHGQGTLSYYFPQNDINKIASLGSYEIVVTKPHNMYLGVAYGSGVPALLALLALLMMSFYNNGRRLLKAECGQALVFPAALFLFCCAMAVQWLFNDVVIEAGVIFWILLGVGVSLNKEYDQLSANSK